MREIRSEIVIQAPPEKVWSILADTEKWGEWNPIVLRASGKFVLGAQVEITMRGPDGQKGAQYSPIVTGYKRLKLIQWHANLGTDFIFSNDKHLELIPKGPNTKLVHKESFGGMMVPLIWSKFKEGVPLMLKAMNESLKITVENGK